MGAKVVNVHGETIVEPVEPGTTAPPSARATVNILAHPGLITPEEAAIAAANGVYLEISSRRGHSLTNGHVAPRGPRRQRRHGAGLGHPRAGRPADPRPRLRVARGAGLDETEALALLDDTPGAPARLLGIEYDA